MKKYIVLILSIIVNLFISCADEPNSTGNQLIPDEDKITLNKIDSYTNSFEQSLSTFNKPNFFGSSSRILLGNFNNLKSEILIDFLILLPDTTKEQLKNSTIKLKSSFISMRPNYWIGDKSDFQFTVQSINRSWNPSTITNDTINSIRNSLSEDILDKSTYNFSDSLITFSFNNSLVNSWINEVLDTEAPKFYGIFLSPITLNSLAGFQALTTFPVTEYILLNMVFEKEGSYIDTITANPSLDIHIVDGELPLNTSNSFILSSGLSVRGNLWFDLSQVPTNILVNKADLQLFIDTLNTFEGSVKTDTIKVSILKNRDSNEVNADIISRNLLRSSSNKYSGDIKQIIQTWLNGEKNEGIEIKLSDEGRSISQIAIWGNINSIDSLKPRLTIYYTQK